MGGSSSHAGQAVFTSGVASTSTSTGALNFRRNCPHIFFFYAYLGSIVVTGGQGISGNLNVGGQVIFSSGIGSTSTTTGAFEGMS